MVIVPAIPKGESALAPQSSVGARAPDDTVVLEVLKNDSGDASFRINHQHIIVEMKCVDWTNESAVGVATVYARFGNYVGHPKSASRCNSVIASKLMITDRRES